MFFHFLAPCTITPCGGNTTCTNNADTTRTCSCNIGYTETDGSNPDNGCDCKHFIVWIKFTDFETKIGLKLVTTGAKM